MIEQLREMTNVSRHLFVSLCAVEYPLTVCDPGPIWLARPTHYLSCLLNLLTPCEALRSEIRRVWWRAEIPATGADNTLPRTLRGIEPGPHSWLCRSFHYFRPEQVSRRGIGIS